MYYNCIVEKLLIDYEIVSVEYRQTEVLTHCRAND